ncbi:glycoside hydrolase family 15 protein [Gandjariella thermophila]|uniref:GH15-like domain-containing protein n=1 Tax=Gandjariella thermophila TaxID=1931992 RepID=A0A4D4JAA8_9PSEU|nr:glycoside hydrolase family 15 protein [Gandjariella thermophila]GDY32252.1 hypothetical protein GTS_38850 [Gandjariella thermophila]
MPGERNDDRARTAGGALVAEDAHAASALVADRGFDATSGHWSQNTTVAGQPYWTSVQLDETAAPMLLAGLLDRHDPATLDHLERGAEFLVNYTKDGHAAPYSEQERWENQSGYSPATIASAVAGLVTLADLLKRAGDAATADRYLAVADRWRGQVDGWTATHIGPYSPLPYYLRLTKDGRPDAGTRYALGDNNPGTVDRPPRPPRWPGRTPSSSGWRGPSRRATRWSGRHRSPAATSAADAVCGRPHPGGGL